MTSPLEDRIAVQDVICALTLLSDLGDFDRSYALYTDDAEMDFSSLLGSGGPLPAAQFRENSKSFRPLIDGTHHQITNFMIELDGDTATSVSQVRAVQHLGDAVGEVGGTYHHRLVRQADGWRISFVRFDLGYRRGENIIELAQRKAQA